MLIGNKSDLEHERKVTFDEGRNFAKNNDLVFFECSALNSNGVEEAFMDAAREIYEGVLT